MTLEFRPVTRECWQDLESLFGECGAYSGCWCMYWRLTRREFTRLQGEGNRRAMKALIKGGTVPGIIAYSNGEPVGWCSIGPRPDFPSLNRSRTLKPVDDQPVWAIVCFFLAAPLRGRGALRELLAGAVAYAREQGAAIVEGYPVELTRAPSGYKGYTGVVSTFRRAGFEEVARRSPAQPVMRYRVS